jgi:hypothetical protein
MRKVPLNVAQKIVLVVGLGIILLLVGGWLTSLGSRSSFGWVAFAPLGASANIPAIGGLHEWVRLVIWLLLVVVWIGVSMGILGDSRRGAGDPETSQ